MKTPSRLSVCLVLLETCVSKLCDTTSKMKFLFFPNLSSTLFFLHFLSLSLSLDIRSVSRPFRVLSDWIEMGIAEMAAAVVNLILCYIHLPLSSIQHSVESSSGSNFVVPVYANQSVLSCHAPPRFRSSNLDFCCCHLASIPTVAGPIYDGTCSHNRNRSWVYRLWGRK